MVRTLFGYPVNEGDASCKHQPSRQRVSFNTDVDMHMVSCSTCSATLGLILSTAGHFA